MINPIFTAGISLSEMELAVALKAMKVLESRYRNPNSFSLPLACGICQSENSRAFNWGDIEAHVNLLVLFENEGVWRKFQANDFVKFLGEREVWQDYDLIALGREGKICYAETHNGDRKCALI